jgi:hypothetical protein
MVWWIRRYANERAPEDRERYERAKKEAKAQKVRLWRDPSPVPPWDGSGAVARNNRFGVGPRLPTQITLTIALAGLGFSRPRKLH